MRKPTIYEALCKKLGRIPTHEEIKFECKRIIAEANRSQSEEDSNAK